MKCFADKTFCTFLDCKNTICDRRLTLEVQKAADKWWGKEKDSAPICMFMAKPKCFEE